MTQLTPFSSIDGKAKTFLQRPEGKAGLFVGAGILVGGGYLLYQALPVLIELAMNTLYLSGMLIALGALLYMVFDPKNAQPDLVHVQKHHEDCHRLVRSNRSYRYSEKLCRRPGKQS